MYSGEFLGKNQRIILHLLDLPFQEQVLRGVQAELHDCAFPLLDEVVITSDLSVAFKDVNYNFLVGAKPRGPGMERADLLKDNGKIFIAQGQVIDAVAAIPPKSRANELGKKSMTARSAAGPASRLAFSRSRECTGKRWCCKAS